MPVPLGTIRDFVNRNGLATVAIGFIVGHSGGKFLESVVEGFVMPLFGPFLDGVDWRDHRLVLGPFRFEWGPVVASALHLAAVLVVVVVVIRVLQREEDARR
jgi:large-conductance mechanosensitive channel